jgi:predicted HTH transcriptional regulator
MNGYLKENFAKFLEEPTRDKLRDILKDNTGEYRNIDFKKEWTDNSKISKHILAMANTGGGIIVTGVEEKDNKTFSICGLKEIDDKAIIRARLNKYLPEDLDYIVMDFTYEDSEYNKLKGKKFQVILVNYDESKIPYVSKSEGKFLRENGIYIREGTSSKEPNYYQLQTLINKRISTYDTSSSIKLEEHLNQLEILYSRIKKYHIYYERTDTFNKFSEFINSFSSAINGEKKKEKNNKYPDEDYEDFIVNLISKKKKRIEKL